MQVQRVQNNKPPYFKGKLILFDANKLSPFDRIIEKEISPKVDKVLHDEFIKLIEIDTKRYDTCLGIRHKNNGYTEFLKKIKEISGIDAEKYSSGDRQRMYSYSYNKNCAEIGINYDSGITLKHEADFLKL